MNSWAPRTNGWIQTAALAGATSGTTTRRNVVSRDAPLAAADSSSSVLIWRTALCETRYDTAIRYECTSISTQMVPGSGIVLLRTEYEQERGEARDDRRDGQ